MRYKHGYGFDDGPRYNKNHLLYLVVSVLAFIILFVLTSRAQCDTTIVNQSYTSVFCKRVHEPLYVVYKLYHGGGACDRGQFHFITDSVKNTATSKDYRGCGYDEGHLAPAADFASDCVREELTFRFYNCVPQLPSLNRGVWKHYETEIRKLSQTDSLLVITGSVFGSTKIPNSNVVIPDYCWKVVQSLSTKKVMYSFMVANTKVCTFTNVDVSEIEGYVKYKLPLK